MFLADAAVPIMSSVLGRLTDPSEIDLAQRRPERIENLQFFWLSSASPIVFTSTSGPSFLRSLASCNAGEATVESSATHKANAENADRFNSHFH
jgi:hypothetical protein